MEKDNTPDNAQMTTYVALLRGINVGGTKRVRMADLIEAFHQLELDHVRTYIQSGNVLFTSNEGEEQLRELIENCSKERFGFPVQVILRTAAELLEIIANNPFSSEFDKGAEDASPIEHLHVALLDHPPRPRASKDLYPYIVPGEQYRVVGREVYLWLPNGIARSRLAASLDRLGVPFTVRNWRTIKALNDLAHS